MTTLYQLFEQHLLPWLDNILIAALIYLIGTRLARLLIKLVRKALERARIDPLLLNFVVSIANGLLTLLIIVAILDQLGFDTTSLIALIGAAGLAVGLALQGTLQNFASGVLLILFKPFRVGDFVEAGGVSGVVEQIRIFTTLFRSGDNKELTVPNAQIFQGTIVNYSARSERRIDLEIAVGYTADLSQVKSILMDLLRADERILAEPEPSVGVSNLGDSAITLVVRPWVKSSDVWAVRCSLLEQIKLSFDRQAVALPYPQLDLHLHRDGEQG